MLPGLGIMRSRTGTGLNRRSLRSRLSTGRNHSSAENTAQFTWAKTAGEILNSLADYLAKLRTDQQR